MSQRSKSMLDYLRVGYGVGKGIGGEMQAGYQRDDYTAQQDARNEPLPKPQTQGSYNATDAGGKPVGIPLDVYNDKGTGGTEMFLQDQFSGNIADYNKRIKDADTQYAKWLSPTERESFRKNQAQRDKDAVVQKIQSLSAMYDPVTGQPVRPLEEIAGGMTELSSMIPDGTGAIYTPINGKIMGTAWDEGSGTISKQPLSINAKMLNRMAQSYGDLGEFDRKQADTDSMIKYREDTIKNSRAKGLADLYNSLKDDVLTSGGSKLDSAAAKQMKLKEKGFGTFMKNVDTALDDAVDINGEPIEGYSRLSYNADAIDMGRYNNGSDEISNINVNGNAPTSVKAVTDIHNAYSAAFSEAMTDEDKNAPWYQLWNNEAQDKLQSAHDYYKEFGQLNEEGRVIVTSMLNKKGMLMSPKQFDAEGNLITNEDGTPKLDPRKMYFVDGKRTYRMPPRMLGYDDVGNSSSMLYNKAMALSGNGGANIFKVEQGKPKAQQMALEGAFQNYGMDKPPQEGGLSVSRITPPGGGIPAQPGAGASAQPAAQPGPDPAQQTAYDESGTSELTTGEVDAGATPITQPEAAEYANGLQEAMQLTDQQKKYQMIQGILQQVQTRHGAGAAEKLKEQVFSPTPAPTPTDAPQVLGAAQAAAPTKAQPSGSRVDEWGRTYYDPVPPILKFLNTGIPYGQ